jgi:hypothetical protein
LSIAIILLLNDSNVGTKIKKLMKPRSIVEELVDEIMIVKIFMNNGFMKNKIIINVSIW